MIQLQPFSWIPKLGILAIGIFFQLSFHCTFHIFVALHWIQSSFFINFDFLFYGTEKRVFLVSSRDVTESQRVNESSGIATGGKKEDGTRGLIDLLTPRCQALCVHDSAGLSVAVRRCRTGHSSLFFRHPPGRATAA